MLEFCFYFSFASAFYAYFGYPLVLLILTPFKRKKLYPPHQLAEIPKLSLIITARNEEENIEQKLRETLALSYFGKEKDRSYLQIIVASDASDDATDDIVSKFSSEGVELCRQDTRQGKEAAQKLALSRAHGSFIVFTDVKIKLSSDALECFAKRFQDPHVGAVSSVDQIEGEGSGEGFYVRYEMLLRDLETRCNSVVGLSGSCFAVRKELCRNLKDHVPSDFSLLLNTVSQGYVGISANEIIGTYQSVSSEAEYKRKVRTILRGITTLFTCPSVFNPFLFGFFSFQIISHKLMRWLVPFFLIAMLLSSLALISNPAFQVVFGLEIFFISLAIIGLLSYELRKNLACKIPLFFSLVNIATFHAWLLFFLGKRSVTWDPSQKGQKI